MFSSVRSPLSPRWSADLLGDTICFEGLKVRMPYYPFRRFKTSRPLFHTCLCQDENSFSVLFAFLPLGTCSHSHGLDPKFTEVIRKTCSDNSFFEQAICYWPHSHGIRPLPPTPPFFPLSVQRKNSHNKELKWLSVPKGTWNICYCLRLLHKYWNHRRPWDYSDISKEETDRTWFICILAERTLW